MLFLLEVPRLQQLQVALLFVPEDFWQHCHQEQVNMDLPFIQEFPRQHQVELHAEESSGAHLGALEVPQNEALLHHHRHLGVFLRATLHILEDSLQLHLEKLLRVLPGVL